jgi:hypothetical protein
MDKDKEFKLEDVIEILGDLKGHKEHLEETKKRSDWFLLTKLECECIIFLLEKAVEGVQDGK